MSRNALIVGISLIAIVAISHAQDHASTSAQATGQPDRLNPQPEPPGVAGKRNRAKPTWSAGSDSTCDGKNCATAKTAGPARKATWSAGSDSGDSRKAHQLNPQPEPPGSTDMQRPVRSATWSAGSDSGDSRKAHQLNPQPEPPGAADMHQPVRAATWSATSDSGSETQSRHLNPQPEPPGAADLHRPVGSSTWAAGSDSGEGSGSTGRDAVVDALQRAHYTNVHDLKRAGAAWEAEAIDSSGDEVEVTVDPDGRILDARKTEAEGRR